MSDPALSDFPLPFPFEASGIEARDFPVCQVPHVIIETLGIEELITYLRLSVWHQRGEAADLRRVADDIWWGETYRAVTWIESLRSKGLLVETAALRGHIAAGHLDIEQAPRSRPSRREPQWGDARWEGVWPVEISDGDWNPAGNVSVVYWQYGAEGLAYVGSTKHFVSRMADHLEHRRSLGWLRWEARECASRGDAYQLEAREIERLKPPQNKQVVKTKARRGADYVRSATR